MSVLRPDARFKGDGFQEIVQAERGALRPGRVGYDEARHCKSVFCMSCNTPVHYQTGSPAVMGGYPGRSACFVTNPNQRHEDDCDMPVQKKGEPPVYDKTRGHRIHFNTLDYSDEFNLAAGPYYRDEQGRVRLKDKSLKPMEPRSIRAADDIVALIRSGDFNRLNHSVVMLRDRLQPLPWRDAFIRYRRPKDRDDRFLQLADRLDCKEFFPAAMEFITDGYRAKDGCATSLPIHHEARRGVLTTYIPRVWPDNIYDAGVQESIYKSGHYIVIGVPRLSQVFATRSGLTRYIDIALTDRRQAAPADLSGLKDIGQHNKAHRRRQLPTLAAE